MSELRGYHRYILYKRSHNHHSPRIGVFALSETNDRKLPTVTDNKTHETIHPSVLQQKSINPDLVCDLLPLEEELRKRWPNIEGKHVQDQSNATMHMRSVTAVHYSLFGNSAVGTVSMDTTRTTIQAHAARPQAANGREQLQVSRLASLRRMCGEFLLTSG